MAETGRGAAGYLIGRDVAGTGEVLNLAVAPEFRRRGIGGALLQAGLAALRRRKVDEVFLEVRESNISAQALYLGYGFRAVGQRAHDQGDVRAAARLQVSVHVREVAAGSKDPAPPWSDRARPTVE